MTTLQIISWSPGAENDSYVCAVVPAGSGTSVMSDASKSEPSLVSECSVVETSEPSGLGELSANKP